MSESQWISAAMAVTDAFLEAFNAGDAGCLAATLGYPHIRLASGRVLIWSSQEEATEAMSANMPLLLERAGWHHSRWDHRRVIHATADKVHLEVQFTRYRADDSVIGVYPAVYAIVRSDKGWKLQCRSSFAP